MKIFPNIQKVRHKLLNEFKGKRILDLHHTTKLEPSHLGCESHHDLTKFPWPIADNSYDLILCQKVLEYLPDTAKTLEELNRIASPGSKILLEAPHYSSLESSRHISHSHRFSLGTFEYFLKGNPFYKTDFHLADRYIFFDDSAFLFGIGFLANILPRQYEKRLAFIFPAISFHITFQVDK
jgi:SAM-dependent methyltransferase